jgi:hypothetical protein
LPERSHRAQRLMAPARLPQFLRRFELPPRLRRVRGRPTVKP